MPEGIEIEYYRRTATKTLGREIGRVDANDAWFLKGGATAEVLANLLVGNTAVAARRVGKLLLIDLANPGVTVGLRFGMTGRLLVDGESAIEQLEYSSGRNDPAWDRFMVHFSDGGHLALRDQRRLGGVELNPDETALGPDLYRITAKELAAALAPSRAPVKNRLMNQRFVAGLGNLLTDEILWRSGLDPRQEARTISPEVIEVLHKQLRSTVKQLTKRGGSHMGDLHQHRVAGALCPRDGAPLERYTIGGRTTYSCSVHQTGFNRTQA